MPRKLPPNVTKEKNRHGTWVFYYRVGKGPRTRLKGIPDSEEFNQAYRDAIVGTATPARPERSAPKTLGWLIERYMETAGWRSLSVATRKQRGNLYRQAVEKSGNTDFRDIRREDMAAAMDKRADTPAQANCFLKAMRSLFDWAARNEHVEIDPTIGVDKISYREEGFEPWAVADIKVFCSKWKIGTKPRLALELLMCSGLRRSDVVLAGRQHMSGTVFSMRTTKTNTEITVEFTDRLMKVINATETGDLHFLISAHGKPFTVESFGNWFRDCCREAGISKSAHGVRKFAATMAANGGASSHEIMAQFGWASVRQAEVYTKKADRKRLGVTGSRVAAEQMEKELSPHPFSGAGKNQKSTMISKVKK